MNEEGRVVKGADIVAIADAVEQLHDAEGRTAARAYLVSAVLFEWVQALVRNGDELARRKSLSLIHYWGNSNAKVELARSLRMDPCPVVRHEAAYFLATLRSVDVVEHLAFALANDDSELVRHEAAEALGDLGFSVAIPALQRALNDVSETVARTARIAIRQLARHETLAGESVTELSADTGEFRLVAN